MLFHFFCFRLFQIICIIAQILFKLKAFIQIFINFIISYYFSYIIIRFLKRYFFNIRTIFLNNPLFNPSGLLFQSPHYKRLVPPLYFHISAKEWLNNKYQFQYFYPLGKVLLPHYPNPMLYYFF